MVLFLVKTGGGFGIGHLKRVLNLIPLLRKGGIRSHVVLMSSEKPKQYHEIMKDVSSTYIPMDDWPDLDRIVNAHSPRVAVLDAREVGKRAFRIFYSRDIPILSFDDYQLANKVGEVSVCPLPYFGKKDANFEKLSFTPFEDTFYYYMEKTKPSVKKRKNILVSFGGTDVYQIAYRVVEALYGTGCDITLIEGPLADYEWVCDYPDIEIIHSPQKLTEYQAKCDVAFTTVGMTMIECLALGKKVVAINPTNYHDRIARTIDGIINLGEYQKVKYKQIQKALEAKPKVTRSETFMNQKKYYEWWNSLVNSMISQGTARCPVCGSPRRKSIQRTENFTLFECLRCQSNYQYLTGQQSVDYNRDYFEEEYKKVYGKTYEQDIINIREYSGRRLNTIKKLTHCKIPRLLDIGAGLGVFVDEAKKQGFWANGAEISPFAREFAKKEFGFEMKASFEEAQGEYDVVTMWFSLEHITYPEDWLNHAWNLLSENGILAIGLPHSLGATGRMNRKKYLQIRPEEHRFEPSLPGLKSLLKRSGFKAEKIEMFGLHPERVALPAWKAVKSTQKMMRLGDTFEIYARKISSSD